MSQSHAINKYKLIREYIFRKDILKLIHINKSDKL